MREGKGEVPREAEHLVDWFHDLAGLHTSGMAVNPLQPSEIEAWARLMQVSLTPWEARTLLRMDQAFLSRIVAKSSAPTRGTIVSVDDPLAGAALMRSLAARVNAKANGGIRKIAVKKDE
jgi:hypothetical protein